MIFSLKKKKKILGGRKRLPRTTNVMGLSEETKKKIEEQMLKNIITDARKKGTL
jgi:hypothetical protein